MELVAFGKEVLQNLAEQAASYRLGQSALRHLDRALWVVEKCARWAVPPPLDQDERPQPELVRPLPWVFFLMLLIALRVTRESISLVNLVMGKPPLRSADVVMYIQSKRRYLRTLKYQGSRVMRARVAAPARPWLGRVRALLELASCRRARLNNNTTCVSNNTEALVVKRKQRGGAEASETTMERLLERMMRDLDADSDDDSSYTLTNVTSIRSDRSDTADSDQDTVLHNENNTRAAISEPRRSSADINFTPSKSAVSTPERSDSPPIDDNSPTIDNNVANELTAEDAALTNSSQRTTVSTKEETSLFLQTESYQNRTDVKTANGAVVNSSDKKGLNSERRDSDVCVIKTKAADVTM